MIRSIFWVLEPGLAHFWSSGLGFGPFSGVRAQCRSILGDLDPDLAQIRSILGDLDHDLAHFNDSGSWFGPFSRF